MLKHGASHKQSQEKQKETEQVTSIELQYSTSGSIPYSLQITFLSPNISLLPKAIWVEVFILSQSVLTCVCVCMCENLLEVFNFHLILRDCLFNQQLLSARIASKKTSGFHDIYLSHTHTHKSSKILVLKTSFCGWAWQHMSLIPETRDLLRPDAIQ